MEPAQLISGPKIPGQRLNKGRIASTAIARAGSLFGKPILDRLRTAPGGSDVARRTSV